MGMYTTVSGLRDCLEAVIGGVSGTGVILTHYEPRKDRSKLIEEYTANIDGERELRGVIITPGSTFHSSVVEASGPVYLDTFSFDVTMYRGAQDNTTARNAALERSCDVLDAIRAKWDLSSYGVTIYYVTATLASHGYGRVKGAGCWLTNISVQYQVYDDSVTPT